MDVIYGYKTYIISIFNVHLMLFYILSSFILCSDNSTSSGSLYESTLSYKEDDNLDKKFIPRIMNEHEEILLCKTPQRTSILSGAQFIRDMIDGHHHTCYELFRMDKETFF